MEASQWFMWIFPLVVGLLTTIASVVASRNKAGLTQVNEHERKIVMLEERVKELDALHRECETRCLNLIRENHELMRENIKLHRQIEG